MIKYIDEQKLIKLLVTAVNECLLNKAAEEYTASFNAIEGVIPDFIQEVSKKISAKFSN